LSLGFAGKRAFDLAGNTGQIFLSEAHASVFGKSGPACVREEGRSHSSEARRFAGTSASIQSDGTKDHFNMNGLSP